MVDARRRERRAWGIASALLLFSIMTFGFVAVGYGQTSSSSSVHTPLSVGMNVTPLSGEIPLPVTLGSRASGGAPPYTYSWSIGNASCTNGPHNYLAFTASTANASTTLDDRGVYCVSVVVHDSLGENASATAMVSAGAASLSAGGTISSCNDPVSGKASTCLVSTLRGNVAPPYFYEGEWYTCQGASPLIMNRTVSCTVAYPNSFRPSSCEAGYPTPCYFSGDDPSFIADAFGNFKGNPPLPNPLDDLTAQVGSWYGTTSESFPPAFTASLSASSDSGVAPLNVPLSYSASDPAFFSGGSVTGCDTNSTTSLPIRSPTGSCNLKLSSPGLYPIEYTAVGNTCSAICAPETATSSLLLAVGGSPTVVSMQPPVLSSQSSISVTTSTAGNPTSFPANPLTWYFGDNSSGYGSSAFHQFTTPGTYLVRLKYCPSSPIFGQFPGIYIAAPGPACATSSSLVVITQGYTSSPFTFPSFTPQSFSLPTQIYQSVSTQANPTTGPSTSNTIPEFPFELFGIAIVTLLVVSSYLLTRYRAPKGATDV